MGIRVREAATAAVLDLSGKFRSAEEYEALRGQVRQLLAENRKNILLNLSEIEKIDSCGLGTLVEAVVATKNRGGKLKLVNVAEGIQKIFVLTHLDPLLEVSVSEEEALAGF